MKRTVPKLSGPAKAIAKGELIGLQCHIHHSPDQGIIGLQGTITDETLNTLTLRTQHRDIQLAKAAITLAIHTPNGPIHIDGRAIQFRPEDRTKKVR